MRHLYAYSYRDHPALSYWRDSATNREIKEFSIDDIPTRFLRIPAHILTYLLGQSEREGGGFGTLARRAAALKGRLHPDIDLHVSREREKLDSFSTFQ